MQRFRNRTTRLKGRDYSKPGYYFLNINAEKHAPIFGELRNARVVLNSYGIIAQNCWLEIPLHYPHVRLDEFVFMPDHMHALLELLPREPISGSEPHGDADGAERRNAPPSRIERFSRPQPLSLGTVLRSYKSAVTRLLRCAGFDPSVKVWQPGFYEHACRSDARLDTIRRYIRNNPAAAWKRKRKKKSK